jgi:hypothetical protein
MTVSDKPSLSGKQDVPLLKIEPLFICTGVKDGGKAGTDYAD